jgi:hypothetical protein
MVRAVRRARTIRFSALAVVLLAPLAPACSILVSTDGLSGAADGGLIDDDSGGSLGDGAPVADAQLGKPSPSIDASASPDAGKASDATSADAETATDTGAKTDTGTKPDAGEDSSVPPITDAAPDVKKDTAAPDAADAKVVKVPCGGDLSNIGTGDFHVTFDLRTTQSGRAALLNQRSACTPGTYWDVRFSSGEIEVETDDGTSYTDLVGTGPDLNDGATHSVVVARVGGTLTITVDGADSGATSAAASFGALPVLASGVDVCDGNDGTVAFEGTLSSVCVSAF